MPRKSLVYTAEAPYHIVARSNNREWFYISPDECWRTFRCNLNSAVQRFGFEVHAFVLMNNHYHLIGQCHKDHQLDEVMGWLQKVISKEINAKAGHSNHVFGGPYRASLIQQTYHYSNVYKYVAQNPVKAGIVEKVEDFPFSSFHKKVYAGNALLLTSSPHWMELIPKNNTDRNKWLNSKFKESEYEYLNEGLKKTVFQPKDRVSRSDPFFP